MSDRYLKDPRANTYQGWIVAFSVLSKYDANGISGRLSTSSEHDILYVGGGPKPVAVFGDEYDPVEEWGNEESKADAELLSALGFHWEEEVESWAKFT